MPSHLSVCFDTNLLLGNRFKAVADKSSLFKSTFYWPEKVWTCLWFWLFISNFSGWHRLYPRILFCGLSTSCYCFLFLLSARRYRLMLPLLMEQLLNNMPYCPLGSHIADTHIWLASYVLMQTDSSCSSLLNHGKRNLWSISLAIEGIVGGSWSNRNCTCTWRTDCSLKYHDQSETALTYHSTTLQPVRSATLYLTSRS